MGRPDSFGIVHGPAVRRDIHGPSCGGQQLLRGNWSGHRMDDPAVWRAEVARDVAAVLHQDAGLVDDLEAAHLLVRCHEVRGEITRDIGILQGDRPECLCVISGKAGILEVPGDVDQEDELSFLLGLLGGRAGRFGPGERRIERAVHRTDLLRLATRRRFVKLQIGQGKRRLLRQNKRQRCAGSRLTQHKSFRCSGSGCPVADRPDRSIGRRFGRGSRERGSLGGRSCRGTATIGVFTWVSAGRSGSARSALTACG